MVKEGAGGGFADVYESHISTEESTPSLCIAEAGRTTRIITVNAIILYIMTT